MAQKETVSITKEVPMVALQDINNNAAITARKEWLELQELEENYSRKNQQILQKEAQKLSVRATEEQRKREDDLKKKACPHYYNETGVSRLVGQYDHRGVVHLVCTNCGKEFNGIETIPPDLQVRVKWDNIGGPQRH